MSEISYYEEYARAAVRRYAEADPAARSALVDALGERDVRRVLDIGCGAGQEMFPFAEKKGAFCVGIDIGRELGAVGRRTAENCGVSGSTGFARARGEELPFADGVFDVVLCRVALPYMDNRRTIAEVARVLRGGGVFLLKTHAPAFFAALLKERLRTLSPKQIAYPLICLFAGTVHQLTGRQLSGGFWEGKQVFQTRRFLEREFAGRGLRIAGTLSDDNRRSPSYLIVKDAGPGSRREC